MLFTATNLSTVFGDNTPKIPFEVETKDISLVGLGSNFDGLTFFSKCSGFVFSFLTLEYNRPMSKKIVSLVVWPW